MSVLIQAPWTDDQVEALNAFQRGGRFHPFTCGKDRTDAAHKRAVEEHGLNDWGLLVATNNGWICQACDYTQTWAHAFMVEMGKKGPFDPLAELFSREAPSSEASTKEAP